MKGLLYVYYSEKFYYFPSEKNFFVRLWHEYNHLHAIGVEPTPITCLDNLLANCEFQVTRKKLSWTKRMLYRRIKLALRDPSTCREIVNFIETQPFPENACQNLAEKLTEIFDPELDQVVSSTPKEHDAVIPTRKEVDADKSPFYARTYIVAAQLSFEIDGRESEYDALCRRKSDLESFIKEKFGNPKLPGTFEEWGGYSYKYTLREKSASKKGQLKPCLRQIIQHPQVFGEAVALRAKAILEENYV